MDDLDNGTDYTTNEFSDRKSNRGGMVDPLEHRAAVLDSNRLKKWTDGKPTKFKVLHVQIQAIYLTWNKPIQQCSLEVNLMQNSFAKIDWVS